MPDQTLTSVALFCQALGDPTRLRILQMLRDASAEGKRVQDLVDGLNSVLQPTVSHHLRTLREAGLVSSRRRGREIYYRVDEYMLTDSLSHLQAYLSPVRMEPRQQSGGDRETRSTG